MFKKNPLVELELAHLRATSPHRIWHYALLILALLISTAPYFHMFLRSDGEIVIGMAIVILGVYWFLQWRVMHSAVKSANHDIVNKLPDEILGTIPKKGLILAKVKAVLKHHRVFLIIITFALLGLSIALMGFLHRTGILADLDLHESPWFLDNIGIMRHGGSQNLSYWQESVLLPHPIQISITLIILLVFTLSNTILGISLSLILTRIPRILMLRLIMIASALILFQILYFNREISEFQTESVNFCERRYSEFPEHCDQIYFEHFFLRINETLQASSFSFIDNGTSLITVLLCPEDIWVVDHYPENGYPVYHRIPSIFGNLRFVPTGAIIRHLLAAGITILSQLSLSGIFLWCVSHVDARKKRGA